MTAQQMRMREALTAIRHPDSCQCAVCSTSAQLTDAVAVSDRVCRDCGCSDSRACVTDAGPCGWDQLFGDDTGICTDCATLADQWLRAYGEVDLEALFAWRLRTDIDFAISYTFSLISAITSVPLAPIGLAELGLTDAEVLPPPLGSAPTPGLTSSATPTSG